jgi:hypothetical protein
MNHFNPLIDMCLPHEHAIRTAYKLEIERMTNANGTRNEFEWGVWCDQDQMYYLAYSVVPKLEDAHDAKQDYHNDFTQWLNALFEIQAARLGFDGSV